MAQDAKLGHEPVKFSQAQMHDGRRRRRVGAVYKYVLAWLFLIGVIFGVTRWIQAFDKTLISGKNSEHAAEREKPPVVDPNREYLDAVVPQCSEVLTRFLSTEQVSARLPLVLARPKIADHMRSYYKENSLLQVDPESLTVKQSTVVDLPEGRAVLIQWESEEGATFDSAFRQQGETWHLDWHHFVRYGDLSWSQFLAGSGENDEAEFRLHARRRLASKDDPHNGVGVVLSAPMRKHLEQTGYEASMMGIPLTESDGRLLQTAFDRAAAKKPLFGAAFSDANPDGMIRVHVQVQRITKDGGSKYRITKVHACHWYASGATGLE